MSRETGLSVNYRRPKLLPILAGTVVGVIGLLFVLFFAYSQNPTKPTLGPIDLPPLYHKEPLFSSSLPTPTPLPTLSPEQITQLSDQFKSLEFPDLPPEAIQEILDILENYNQIPHDR